jgi:hypothetical protein
MYNILSFIQCPILLYCNCNCILVCVSDYEGSECRTYQSRTDSSLHGLLDVSSLRMAGSNS